MKTIAVWVMLSFLPGQPNDRLQFPDQPTCEQFAHQLDWQYKQATHVNAPPSRCVKTNIVVSSNDGTR